MGKKITMTESQKRRLDEMFEDEVMTGMMLPDNMLRDITVNNTSISDYPFFLTPNGKRYLAKVVTDRYNEVISHFDDDVVSVEVHRIEEEIEKVMEKCRKKEEPIRQQLEKLCMDTVIELFGIPENSISFTCSLTDKIDPEKEFAVNPMPVNGNFGFESLELMDEESGEIQKRRMVNCLSMGAAMRLFAECRKLYLDKLFDLDEELPYLYSRFTKLNELYLFRKEIKLRDRVHQQGGYVDVMLGNNETLPQIKSKAVMFPILLTESIKGFMELFASHGLPDDIETTKKVIDVADALAYEPWDMRIGPALFDDVFGRLEDAESKVIPYFYTNLVKLKVEDFLNVLKSCMCNVEDVDDFLNATYNDAKHDAEYDGFDCGLIGKQDDGALITDSQG